MSVPVGTHVGSGVYIPKTMPTGVSVEELRGRFQAAVALDLLGARLAYLYVVLFDASQIMEYIDDGYLSAQVEAGRIENSTALFRCAALVESAVEGRQFKRDPANTLATYLRERFKQRGWDWPKSPLAWKQHFVEHHGGVFS